MPESVALSTDSSVSADSAAASPLPALPTTTLQFAWWAISSVPFVVWFGIGLAFLWVHNLYVNQGRLLYHPSPPGLPFKRTSDNPPPYNSPGAAVWGNGGLSWAEVRLRAADGMRLHGWFVRARPPPELTPESAAARFSRGAPTVVFFHANAGNLGLRMPNVAVLALHARVNVFIFDYRGYGDSEGSEAEISEPGLTADGVAALRSALSRSEVDPDRVFLFGRSLGGAVALAALAAAPAADRAAVAGVILENTFTSIADMVDVVLPSIAWLKPLILRIRWDSTVAIAGVTQPLLFISGEADALVPQRMMRRLHDLATVAADREFYSVPGGEHNDSFTKGGAEYILRVLNFMRRALERRGLQLYDFERMVEGVDPATESLASAGSGDAAVPRERLGVAAIDATSGAAALLPLPAAALGAGPDLLQALSPHGKAVA